MAGNNGARLGLWLVTMALGLVAGNNGARLGLWLVTMALG